MRQVKTLDFAGQTIFCGIDVHKRQLRICLRTHDRELKTFSQNPSAEELVSYLHKHYPGAQYRAVYEAGFSGFSYQRELARSGVNCIVVHAADVPSSHKDQVRKSDGVDCRKLCRSLSDGSIQGVYIPSDQQQQDRSIIRVYRQVVKDQARCKNRIWSWLMYQGINHIAERTYWSQAFIQELRNLTLPPTTRKSLDILLSAYEQTRSLAAHSLKEVRELSKAPHLADTIRLLRTIPGVGMITSVLFATEIGDISRFKKLDQLCDYIGLVPRTASSGETQRVYGMTHRGHKQLREKLIESSWVAVSKDPALTFYFNECAKRMKKNKAIIRIARKMLNRIYYVMRTKKEYQTSVSG